MPTSSNNNKCRIQDEPCPSFEHVDPRTKTSYSEPHPPETPDKPLAIKSSTHENNIIHKSTLVPYRAVVAGSSCCRLLRSENGLRKRSYQLEFMVHKKQKSKGEWHGAKAPKNEENIKETSIQESEKADVDEQSSDIPFDVEVIGYSKKKQVCELDHSQEAESIPTQVVSSASSPKSHYNTLTPSEIQTHIEKQVVARVASQVEALRAEMIEKMEAKIREMFENARRSDRNRSQSKKILKYLTSK